jgi:hypothetical protein
MGEEGGLTKLIARKGEIVTCENGHEICDVAEDIEASSIVRRNQFTAWRQPEHAAGDGPAAIGPCTVCGARWVGVPEGKTGSYLHIGDQWRPMWEPPA